MLDATHFKRLAAPFPEDQIEWRIGQSGVKGGKAWAMCLAYVQARAIMDRLDDVCGPENWKVSYQFQPSGIIADLSIRCGNEWVTKQDGAEPTDIESFKGGLSSALKRAGSVWGIGRYLYDLEAGFAQTAEGNTPGMRFGKTKDGVVFYWKPPKLPDWALPKKLPSAPVLPVKRIHETQAVPTVEVPASPPAIPAPLQKEVKPGLSERQKEILATLRARGSAWTTDQLTSYSLHRFSTSQVDALGPKEYDRLLFILREQTAESAFAVLRATSAVERRSEAEEAQGNFDSVL